MKKAECMDTRPQGQLVGVPDFEGYLLKEWHMTKDGQKYHM